MSEQADQNAMSEQELIKKARIVALETELAASERETEAHRERAERFLRVERERLLTFGFPRLSPNAYTAHGCTNSSPASSSKHQPASVIIKELALLNAAQFQPKHVHRSQTWAAAAACAPEPLYWFGEFDIEGYVKQALGDCLMSSGLQHQLQLLREFSVDDQRPEVWLINAEKRQGATNIHVPVGVCQVQKPGVSVRRSNAAAADSSRVIHSPRLREQHDQAADAASAASSASSVYEESGPGLQQRTLLGQLFDYMCMLRTLHGIRYVFGIVTNYAEWRIVWLPDTDQAAQAIELPYRDVRDTDPNTPFNRVLHGTAIYKCDNLTLIPQLVSALHKMHEASKMAQIDDTEMAETSHESLEQLIDTNLPRWCLSESPTYEWTRLDSSFRLKLLQTAHTDSQRFLLLQDYRGGADGRVWLVAAESTGALGVIKFQRRQRRHFARVNLLEAEAQLWWDVWRVARPAARVVRLAYEPALLLPFAFHAHRHGNSYRFLKPNHLLPDQHASYLSDVDCEQLERLIADADADPMAVAKNAIHTMAEAGYEHTDMHWRHVAFLANLDCNNQLRSQAVLIDLAAVKQLDSAMNASAKVKAAAEKRMLAALKRAQEDEMQE